MNIEVSREKGKFVTNVYRKPVFSRALTQFESFLPTTYKFGIIYTLAYRCFKICSEWTKFQEELSFLKQVSLKNGYPLSLIDNILKHKITCFKTSVDKLFSKRPQQLRRKPCFCHCNTFVKFPYKLELSKGNSVSAFFSTKKRNIIENHVFS